MDQWVIVMLMLLSVFCLGQEASNNQVTAYVSGMAELKCHFNNPKNYSLQQLIIFWQKKPRNGEGNHHVVAELYYGKKNYINLDENYKNRTTEITPNGDLHLFNITLEDEGNFYCYVQKRINDKIEKEHNKDCKLNVLANFSVPRINYEHLPVVENDSAVKIRCSSTDGFPKPSGILFTVYDENITQSHHKDCEHEPSPLCNIMKTSQMFNISGYLTLNVTSNISIICTVLAHHNVSSKKIHVGVTPKITISEKENENLMYILATVTLIVVVTIGGGIYFGCRKNGKMCRSRSPWNVTDTLTTPAPNNEDTQQPEESTSFIGAEANVS